jgi:cytochrome c
MNIRYLLMLAAGLALASNAFAGDGEALMKKSNCTTCHSVDKKGLGPSFKDIAAKYKDDKGGQDTLEKKVRSGGSGAWGKMPMPATAKSVSDDDIKSIVQWVLSLK